MQHSATCLGVLLGEIGIAVGVAALDLHGFRTELLFQLRRCSHHQTAGWNILSDNGTGGHQGAFTHGDTVENDGSYSNKAAIQ